MNREVVFCTAFWADVQGWLAQGDIQTLLPADRMSGIILISLFLLIIAVLLWSWSLRRQIKIRMAALQESKDKFKYVFEAANVGKSITLLTGKLNVNKAFADFLGYTPKELKDKTWQELTPAGDIETIQRSIDCLLRGEQNSARFEKKYLHKNGTIVWGDVSTRIRRDNDGQPLYFITTVVDINRRKRAEEAVHKAIENLRITLDSIGDAVIATDITGNITRMNPVAEKLTGWAFEEADGKPIEMVFCIVNAQTGKKAENPVVRVLESGHIVGLANHTCLISKNGEQYQIADSASPIKDKTGHLAGVVMIFRDVSEEYWMREAIAASELQLKKAQAIGKLGSWQLDLNTGKVSNSEESYRIYGLEPGKDYSIPEIQKIPLPEYRQMLDVALERLINGEDRYDVEFKIKRPADGHIIDICSVAEYDQQKNTVTGTIQDVTARKQAEKALRESDSRFRLLADTAPVGIVIMDSEQKTIYVSQQFVEMFGYTIDDFPTFEEWWPLAYPDEALRTDIREKWMTAVKIAVKNRSAIDPMEYPVRCKDGSIRHIEFRMASTGELNFVIFTDISERHKIESQLRQALKMEAVGRLAGGVAHDYNNMLGVIIGYAELAMNKVGSDASVHADLKEILIAARRSADITRQLLAFARKQTIRPQVIDLNETVESMLKMLRRLIGENIDLVWRPGFRVWPVNMDPAQVDQVLANLCVNARDAIADLGKVTIETDNVSFDETYCADHADFISGEFVLLAVSDNGCGMDEKTKNNLFEPFFTTKDVNEGTGLGMSTVYGIIKQNHGFINVYSESGKGTTFKLYLPRHMGEVKEKRAQIPGKIPTGRGETVLLVEDDPQIIIMGQTMLEKLNYHVLAASTPSEAIRLSEKHAGEIHLLITDVIMPDMNGRDLAVQILTCYPGIRILFMSGYTSNVIAHHGALDKGVNFIQKPFGTKELAVKVREVLSQEQ